MQFEFRENTRLPLLSWAVEIENGRAVVHHGPKLERGENWFVDGCWAGPFEPERSQLCLGFFAFHGWMDGDDLVIDTPPLERLFFYKNGSRVLISPSVSFVLALAGASFDPEYPDYIYDSVRSISCLAENRNSIPLRGAGALEAVINRRVRIGPDLAMRDEVKLLERDFRSFEEYQSFLAETLRRLEENAASPRRQRGTYRMMCSVSRGYDSVAVCGLLADAGYREAITLAVPEDCGDVIGKHLGVQTHVLESEAYRKMSSIPEAEFLAAGFHGQDLCLAGAEAHLTGKLFVSGISGDKVWGKDRPPEPFDLSWSNGSGFQLTEFRWRIGSLHAALPFSSIFSRKSLLEISKSKEMERWSVGGGYDRPIPRRIAEERGVPRESFGLAKRGLITMHFYGSDKAVMEMFSKASLEAFERFYARARRERSFKTKAARAAIYVLYRIERFVGHKLKRAGVLKEIPCSFARKHHQWPGRHSYLFCWATETVKERYAKALETNAAGPRA